MQVLDMIFYTAIMLGALIFIHELGHFLAAKFTGMRVDRFSIGFPPRAFGKKIGETDYCISWIPIGGYVKISGMVDESFDTEFLRQEAQPWEFRSKPMWAKMFVISAGVIMNILLSILIFWGINYSRGKLIKETTQIGYVIEGSHAEQAGLLAGDKIISVNGKPVTHWDEIHSLIYLENYGNDVSILVERGVEEKSLRLPRNLLSTAPDQLLGIVEAHSKVIIRDVLPGKPAEQLGLQRGDEILSLNDSKIINERQMISIVRDHVGKSLKITWSRGEQALSGSTIPDDNGKIGVSLASVYNGPYQRIEYSILGALWEGLKDIVAAINIFFKSIGQIISGKVTIKESFGGPIAIAQLATQTAELGLMSYLGFMALLSMSLAILNILPIPALDGGHLVMILVEKVFRREIPSKVKIAIQQAGFILLLAFMAFIIYNDISRL
ncbi:MAG TPA: RIP metalloprotease RseP [Bacteroidota bacterium]|nr:RIP metalloprotease RseP [Bacteroidota bacterium]